MVLFQLLICVIIQCCAGGDVKYIEDFPLKYGHGKNVDVYIGKLETNSSFTYYAPLNLSICDYFGLKDKQLGQLNSTLGSELRGDMWLFSPRLRIVYNKSITDENLCIMPLQGITLKNLERQIDEGVKVTYLIDGIPTTGYLGFKTDDKYYVFSHRTFEIHVFDDKIVNVEVIPSQAELVKSGATIEFSYSVVYKQESEDHDRYSAITSSTIEYDAVDDMYLISAYGFSILLSVFVGAIFSILFNGAERITHEWTLVPESLQRIFVLKPYFYVKPKNTILLSVAFTYGAQVVLTSLLFLIEWMFASKDSFAQAQLSGAFITSYIRTLVFSNFLGGLIGGSFMKVWQVRRYRRAFIVQFMIPVVISGIVATQMRHAAVVARTSMAWPMTTLGKMMLYVLIALGLYIGGFFTGHTYAHECDISQNIEDEGTVNVSKQSKIVLMAVNAFTVSLSFFTGLYQSYLYIKCVFIEPICITHGFGPILKHVIPGLVLYVVLTVLTCFVCLCIGYTKWQKNCVRLGFIWFLFQFIVFMHWFRIDGHIENLYTLTWIGGLCGVVCASCGAAALTVAYITKWVTLKIVFDERKSE